MAIPNDAVVRRVPARVGLVGNPSDGYGGAVLGTVVPGLIATVTAAPSDDVEFGVGDRRIISAALSTLTEHIRSTRADPGQRGVRLTWTTNIPRSVGLAGSSALAVGVIDATAALWNVPLDRRVVAALALAAERDVLGIAAGWQDRIIQSFGCSLLVDAGAMEVVDSLSVPSVTTLAPGKTGSGHKLSLLVGWNEAAATTSEEYHGALRTSAPSLSVPMRLLAELARRAATAFSAGDIDQLARAVDEGWTVRQSCAPLRGDHTELVEIVRATGLAATTPGSGGAVVAVCPDDDAAVARAVGALVDAGCAWRQFPVELRRRRAGG